MKNTRGGRFLFFFKITVFFTLFDSFPENSLKHTPQGWGEREKKRENIAISLKITLILQFVDVTF